MKSRYLLNLVALVTAVSVLCTGCTHLGKKSPTDVLQAFFAAANAGRYSEAEQYFTSSAKSMMVLGGGIKKSADRETRDGKVDTVEILSTETRGEGTKLKYRIHYKGGQVKNDDATLIIENGDWRIAG